MKTILIGYPDKLGKENPKTIANVDVPLKDKMEIVNEAKRQHKFPKGILRMELYVVGLQPFGEATETAIFSDEKTAQGLQSMHAAFQKAEAENQKERDDARKQQAHLEANREKIVAAAQKRNLLLGEKHQLESRIRNLGLALEHKVAESGTEKKIKDLQAQLAELNPKIEAAIAEYESLAKPGKSQPETKNTVTI